MSDTSDPHGFDDKGKSKKQNPNVHGIALSDLMKIALGETAKPTPTQGPEGHTGIARNDEATEFSESSNGPSREVIAGKYHVLEPLGEGGMGVVYLAEQREPVRRKVALKVMKDGGQTKEFIARFEAERQALALMDHPNIAHVFDGGKTETGGPYFVMEFVDGIPLSNFCDHRRLNINERLELFMDVCEGVEHAHQRGIIHRDLKPGNILVTHKGSVGIPKIIDFGIAKTISMSLTDLTLHTKVGTVLGTPAYTSPEQFNSDGLGVDTRADIYALGAILYELLTGQPPLPLKKTTSWSEICRIICDQEPSRPSTVLATLAEEIEIVSKVRSTPSKRLCQNVKGDLDWIVLKCLEKNRDRRYESVGALRRDIERHLANNPVEARPPSKLYLIGKFVRRNRAKVVMAAALIALLIGWTISALYALSAEEKAASYALAVEKDAAKRREKIMETFTEMLSIKGPLWEIPDDFSVNQMIADYSPTILQKAQEDPETGLDFIDLLRDIGYTTQSSDLALSEDFLRTVLKLAKENRGTDHTFTLGVQTDIAAMIRMEDGRVEEAEEMLLDTRNRLKTGPDEPDRLTVLSDTLRWLVDIYGRTDQERAEVFLSEWKGVLRRQSAEGSSKMLYADTAEGLILVEKGKRLLKINQETEALDQLLKAIDKLEQVRAQQRQLVKEERLERNSPKIIGALQALAGAQWATEELPQLLAAEKNLSTALLLAEERYKPEDQDPKGISQDLADLRAEIKGLQMPEE